MTRPQHDEQPRDPLPQEHARKASRLFRRMARTWGVPAVAKLKVVVRCDLRRTLGRFSPRTGLIEVAAGVLSGAGMEAVLLHEAAHAAVASLQTDRHRPHGADWRRLMALAGDTRRGPRGGADTGRGRRRAAPAKRRTAFTTMVSGLPRPPQGQTARPRLALRRLRRRRPPGPARDHALYAQGRPPPPMRGHPEPPAPTRPRHCELA